LTRLERAYARWKDALSEHERARRGLEREIWLAWLRGVSQSDIARALGWPRQRVNAVLGKAEEKRSKR
jgi:DNA-binding transcriptional regulator LsrR (DeoR family)